MDARIDAFHNRRSVDIRSHNRKNQSRYQLLPRHLSANRVGPLIVRLLLAADIPSDHLVPRKVLPSQFVHSSTWQRQESRSRHKDLRDTELGRYVRHTASPPRIYLRSSNPNRSWYQSIDGLPHAYHKSRSESVPCSDTEDTVLHDMSNCKDVDKALLSPFHRYCRRSEAVYPLAAWVQPPSRTSTNMCVAPPTSEDCSRGIAIGEAGLL